MKFYPLFKRLFDFISSLMALIILLPVFIIIIIAIRLQTKGPAIFKQTRAANIQNFSPKTPDTSNESPLAVLVADIGLTKAVSLDKVGFGCVLPNE